MTQIFQLELTAATPVDRLAREVHEIAVQAGLMDEQVPPTELVQGVVTFPSGLWVDVFIPRRTGPDEFATAFGIERAVTVSFQVNGHRDYGPQWTEMLWVVLELLDRVAGDAVLHFEYAAVWLLRRDGQLFLSDQDDIWFPERLSMVPRPYERVPLAFSGA